MRKCVRWLKPRINTQSALADSEHSLRITMKSLHVLFFLLLSLTALTNAQQTCVDFAEQQVDECEDEIDDIVDEVGRPRTLVISLRQLVSLWLIILLELHYNSDPDCSFASQIAFGLMVSHLQ